MVLSHLQRETGRLVVWQKVGSNVKTTLTNSRSHKSDNESITKLKLSAVSFHPPKVFHCNGNPENSCPNLGFFFNEEKKVMLSWTDNRHGRGLLPSTYNLKQSTADWSERYWKIAKNEKKIKNCWKINLNIAKQICVIFYFVYLWAKIALPLGFYSMHSTTGKTYHYADFHLSKH